MAVISNPYDAGPSMKEGPAVSNYSPGTVDNLKAYGGGTISGVASQNSVAGQMIVFLADQGKREILRKIAQADGEFEFVALAPGNYWVRVESPDATYKSEVFGPVVVS